MERAARSGDAGRAKLPVVRPGWIVLAAAVYFAALTNRPFWGLLFEGHSLRSLSGWLLVPATLALLTAAHILLLVPFSSRYLLRPFLSVILVANAATMYFIDRFHVVIDADMMRNVFQTDAKETRELITSGMLATVALYALVPMAILWVVKLRRESLRQALASRALLAALAVLLIFGAALSSFRTYAAFFRNHREAKHLVIPVNLITSSVQAAVDSGAPLDTPRIAVGTDATLGPAWSSPRPVLFVLVVGETARAAEFSIDGYARPTTPHLQHAGVVNFPDVLACGTATAQSLPCMFSPFGRSEFSPEKAHRYESLLDVVHHAGLPVLWLDNNSGCKGVCDGVETERLDSLDVPGICAEGECLDAILVRRLETLLSDPPSSRMLVLHQKGSHGPAYYRRYPEEFRRFVPDCRSQDFDDCTPQEIRNAYDDSILYTDFILGEVIDRLAAAKDYDTALLYVSDHGESLGERGMYLHGLPYAIAPDVQKKVPMVFWTSPSFANRFGIDKERLAGAARTHTFSHDHLFHSILGLLDIRTRVRDHRLDLFREARVARREVSATPARVAAMQ